MKKIKMSLLAVAALVGVSAAFASKSASKATFSYGITGLTSGGAGYVIVPFDHDFKKCNTNTAFTCAVTSSSALTSPVAKGGSGHNTYRGQYVNQ